jgi:hypothetical protein
MSALYTPITPDQLKAPRGQFRLVRSTTSAPFEYFLVSDFANRHNALDEWRGFYPKRDENETFQVLNDEGREVRPLGIVLNVSELKAPKGKFRLVCIDAAAKGPNYFLVEDVDDREKAIAYANEENSSPGDSFVGHQVFDDAGAALIAA